MKFKLICDIEFEAPNIFGAFNKLSEHFDDLYQNTVINDLCIDDPSTGHPLKKQINLKYTGNFNLSKCEDK